MAWFSKAESSSLLTKGQIERLQEVERRCAPCAFGTKCSWSSDTLLKEPLEEDSTEERQPFGQVVALPKALRTFVQATGHVPETHTQLVLLLDGHGRPRPEHTRGLVLLNMRCCCYMAITMRT